MNDITSEIQGLLERVFSENRFVKASLSAPRHSNSVSLRTDIRPISIRGEEYFQFTNRTRTQHDHKNLDVESTVREVVLLMRETYRMMNLRSTDRDYSIHCSKKGRIHIKETKLEGCRCENDPSQPALHNRKKNYLIPEDKPCPFLIELGVMSKEGRVRRSHYHKFRQINRFAEFVHDVVGVLPENEEIKIVDFGCGKSYLTFATHFLLTEVLGRTVDILGLDRRADVVRECDRVSKKLGLKGLRFETGDIANFEHKSKVDLVVALHACNCASDDALFRAARWNAGAVLVAPCCHHELLEHLTANAQPPITQYGVLLDRYATIATDAMRAALMTTLGYKTQVLEFIETEHTPKNILIRCVRENLEVESHLRASAYHELCKLRDSLHVPPMTLERLLRQAGMLVQNSI